MTDRPQTPLQKQYSRRDVLKVAATALAVASFPVVGAAPGNVPPPWGAARKLSIKRCARPPTLRRCRAL